jgi:hypothetical protein
LANLVRSLAEKPDFLMAEPLDVTLFGGNDRVAGEASV